MKKIIFLSTIALLCASMVFAAGITEKNLKALKGTWEGIGTGPNTANVKIEIMNDTEPLQGKMTFSNIPQIILQKTGLSDPTTGESNDGKITTAGTIMFTGPNGFFEITSIKGKKLSGWGYFRGFKADITAIKK